MEKGEENKAEASEKTAGTQGRDKKVEGGGPGAAGKGCGEV